MPRISRAVAVGFPHHITQRGNYRQSVFERKDDYLFYLEWLKTYSSKYSLKIWAYCLMKNHVHFIAARALGSDLHIALCVVCRSAPKRHIYIQKAYLK